MTTNEVALVVVILSAFFNLLGILYNHKLSQKLNNANKDDDDKRELRIKIHDRLSAFEDAVNSEEIFSPKIVTSMRRIARRVKLYDPYLSTMISVFVTHWKGYMERCQYTKGEIQTPDYLVSFTKNISDRADELITKPSVFKLLKSRWSWFKFRVKLFRKEPDCSTSLSLPLHRP